MRVLVTGASGHIASAVIPELLGAGHTVVGLVRSDASAAAVEALGAEARRGDLTDLAGLREAAAGADGVVHLAFDHAAVHAGDLAGAAEADLAVVTALGDGLAGRGGPFLGIGLGAAHVDPALAAHPRGQVAEVIAGYADRGVRPVLIGVPQVVHSTRDRGGFLPTLIGLARRTGVSGYVGEGATRWPAVHTLDLGHLFRLALDEAPAGARLPAAAEEGVTVREIAETIGRHLGLPVESIAPERAVEHFGPFGGFIMDLDNPMPSESTQQLLGWKPEQPGLIADLDEGHYFATR